MSALASCGGTESSSTPTLTWWVAPDRVGARSIAETCSSATDDYSIDIELLPPGIDQQRAEIVRRLTADDHTIDILSLDNSLTAEVVPYLADVPADLSATFTDGVFPKAVEAASFDGRLVAAPWYLDPQVLWFRGAAAERAGLDTTKPVGWDDLLAGAERLGTTLQIDDPDGNGLSDWIRALIGGAGGQVLDGPGRTPKVGLSTDAGRVAAGIVQFYSGASVGPGPSAEALAEFAGPRGGFLLADTAVYSDPALATVVSDMRATAYPVVESDNVAPLSGVALAVPKAGRNPDVAYAAVTCLTSEDSQREMMIGSGHGAARESVYEDAAVKEALPAEDVALQAVATGANVPSTPYWQRVRAALRDSWTPLTSVSPATTPSESAKAVRDRVAGGL